MHTMTTNKKRTTTSSSTKSQSMDSHRPHNVRMVQNFHLVWLDENIEELNNDDYRNSITKLRQVVNTVNSFTDADECIDFITDNHKENTFMMVSGALSQIIVPVAQDISQISSIYIVCQKKMQSEKWTKEWSKVKGVDTDITSICEALKQATQACDQNLISISFVQKTDTPSNQNLDQLDQSFMYTQILKEIILSIDFEQKHMNEFLMYCREQFIGNTIELQNVDKIEKEYRCDQSIWWYTYSCSLYSMLNRALRLMEVDLIIKMGFFVRDLHNHITTLHAEQYNEQTHLNPFLVYRGQGLSHTDFDQLKQTQGGLMSFNNFLSTSLDRAVSFSFAESNQDNFDFIGVLFVIKIDPSISTTPYANVGDVSCYKGEEEILFSMHSVFRIGQMKQIDGNNRLWQVDLTLTRDNDPQLHALTESMREETSSPYKGWHRLGKLMMQLGQFNQAEELYAILLKQTTDESEKGHLFHHLGCTKSSQGKYAHAVGFYEKALEIFQKTLPVNHSDWAVSYNNIGEVYHNMGESSKALAYFEKGLEIYQKTLPANHPSLATSYNNIGEVYRNMGEYSKALSYYEKALEIFQKTLPTNHPDLATSYSNIGVMYYHMSEYSKALSYYEKALEILQKTLPGNHPDLATSYSNTGDVYCKMGEYSKALSYSEKALEIRQKTLPANHTDLAISYNNIGGLYDNMGEYSKALSYFEKALAIWQKTLPANHPDLATTYNNIGTVYTNMRGHSKALSSYEKALEIRQKTLPANHPDFAQSYNNIGTVYTNMREYSKALAYYKKALEMEQNTLPANHPLLATSYSNIGMIYYHMSEYSKALSYYEKALEILQKTLPANHPDLATTYSNIGMVYDSMSEYSKALSYYEKVLEIRQKTLPADHRSLATSYSNIGLVYDNMGEYSKALSYCEHALDIFQSSLPLNHPHLQTVRQTIQYIKRKL